MRNYVRCVVTDHCVRRKIQCDSGSVFVRSTPKPNLTEGKKVVLQPVQREGRQFISSVPAAQSMLPIECSLYRVLERASVSLQFGGEGQQE